MSNEYKYYKENGKLMRLHIVQDNDPINPRVDFDCNIGKIVCWGNNWGYLGDKQNKWNDAEDFFKELCMEHLTEEQVESLVNKRMGIVSIESPAVEKPNKAEYEKDIRSTVLKYNAMAEKAKELELSDEAVRYINMAKAYKRNREDEFEKNLRLSKEYKVTNDIGWFQYKGTKEQCEDYINGELREGLLDGDIFYASAGMYKEAMKMLKESDVVILPVFVFEHSGTSISVSEFGDRWDSGQAGWIYTTKEQEITEFPDELTREHYSEVRECFNKGLNTYPDWYIGAIGFLGSYNGRFYDGGFAKTNYSKSKTTDHIIIRNYYKEAKENLIEQIPRLEDIQFQCGDYEELYSDKVDCLFYCDIPYKGTKQYGSSKNFDYDRFWNWAEKMSERNIVLVSEHEAPSEWECIWQQEVKRTIDNTKRVKAVEKLFEIRE